MRMTIDEIMAKETEIAHKFQKVIDTHMVDENTSLEEMYCDDTEVIEEHLQRCKVIADYHNQIANTMCKYQKIEQIVSEWNNHCISTQVAVSEIANEVLEDGNIG